MAKARKPAIDLGNIHRGRERWSFSEQHQFDVEMAMRAGKKAPKGRPRTWQQATKYDKKK